MMKIPRRAEYAFYFNHKLDRITFTLQLEGAGQLFLCLGAEAFISLCEGIAEIYPGFLENVKRLRAEGIKEDIKVEFNKDQWDKMMGINNKEEASDG